VKNRILYAITHMEEIIAASALSCMAFTACINVFTRYIMNNPLTWAEELECICLVFATFVGGAACYKRNLHYGMDFLVDRLPENGKMFLRKTLLLLFIVLFIYLTGLSYKFALSASKTTTFFRIKYKYIDFAAVLGFGSMAFYSLRYFIQSFTDPQKFAARYASAYANDGLNSEERDAKGGNGS